MLSKVKTPCDHLISAKAFSRLGTRSPVRHFRTVWTLTPIAWATSFSSVRARKSWMFMRTDCAPTAGNGQARFVRVSKLLIHKYNLCAYLEYQTVRTHLENLDALYKALRYSDRYVAKEMGWKSDRTVAMKLSGERALRPGELQRMCTIAKITIAELADMSSDLEITKYKEALKAARLLDKLSDSTKRAQAIKELERIVAKLEK